MSYCCRDIPALTDLRVVRRVSAELRERQSPPGPVRCWSIKSTCAVRKHTRHQKVNTSQYNQKTTFIVMKNANMKAREDISTTKKFQRLKELRQFSSFPALLDIWAGLELGPGWRASLSRWGGCGLTGRTGAAYINSRGVTQPTLGLRKRLAGGE